MHTPKNILIVDDSEFVQEPIIPAYWNKLSKFAGDHGWSTAVMGWRKLYTSSFDLVLTDVNMANMDGYEFIRRVRADEKYSSLPIIIVSTESEAKDKMKGFEAGANLYIVKPQLSGNDDRKYSHVIRVRQLRRQCQLLQSPHTQGGLVL